jgi:hypothetical protein
MKGPSVPSAAPGCQRKGTGRVLPAQTSTGAASPLPGQSLDGWERPAKRPCERDASGQVEGGHLPDTVQGRWGRWMAGSLTGVLAWQHGKGAGSAPKVPFRPLQTPSDPASCGDPMHSARGKGEGRGWYGACPTGTAHSTPYLPLPTSYSPSLRRNLKRSIGTLVYCRGTPIVSLYCLPYCLPIATQGNPKNTLVTHS